MRALSFLARLTLVIALALGSAPWAATPASASAIDATPDPSSGHRPSIDEGVAKPASADGTIPYVIVTDQSLLPEFRPLATPSAHAGLRSAIRTVQAIRSAYTAGVDDAESIRMFLKDAYANWGTRWVLLGGDDPLVPVRRAFLRLPELPGYPEVLLPTDQYYACLGGTWNADGDTLWGELPNPGLGEPGDDVDLVPELNVGRAPVTNPAEARDFVARTLKELGPPGDVAPHSDLFAASHSFFIDFAQISEVLIPLVASDPETHVARLYQNWTAWPGSFQETRASLLDSLDRGYDLAVLVGNGGAGLFDAGGDPQELLPAQDLLGLTNRRAPSHVIFMSAYTCKPGMLSIGAALMRAPEGGAVSVLGTTDLQFISMGFSFVQEFLTQAYVDGAPTLGEALTRAILEAGTPSYDFARLTYQGYMLLGDPAIALPGVPSGPATTRRPPAAPVAARALRSYTTSLASAAPAAARTPQADLVLQAPLPNPASTAARMDFIVPGSADGASLQVDVLDVAGRRVRALDRGSVASGPASVAWDLRDDGGARVREGLYFMRVSMGPWTRVARIAVLP